MIEEVFSFNNTFKKTFSLNGFGIPKNMRIKGSRIIKYDDNIEVEVEFEEIVDHDFRDGDIVVNEEKNGKFTSIFIYKDPYLSSMKTNMNAFITSFDTFSCYCMIRFEGKLSELEKDRYTRKYKFGEIYLSSEKDNFDKNNPSRNKSYRKATPHEVFLFADILESNFGMRFNNEKNRLEQINPEEKNDGFMNEIDNKPMDEEKKPGPESSDSSKKDGDPTRECVENENAKPDNGDDEEHGGKWIDHILDPIYNNESSENQETLLYELVSRKLFCDKRRKSSDTNPFDNLDICYITNFGNLQLFDRNEKDFNGISLDDAMLPNNCTTEKQGIKLMAYNKLMNVAKYLNISYEELKKSGKYKNDIDKRHEGNYSMYIDNDGKILSFNVDDMKYIGTTVCFRNPELVSKAVEILGEDVVRLALSTDW